MCIWIEESTNLQWTDHPITIANYQSHDPNHWWFYDNTQHTIFNIEYAGS